MNVREKPPLRLTTEAVTPSGKVYRWASDAPDARDRPTGRRFSSTIPGGYETTECTLPRRAGDDDADLDRLTTLQHLGPGGDVAGEYRLERAPRVSGDQMAVSPSGVGWQAHLADDKSVRLLGIDRELNHWLGISRSRQALLITGSFTPFAGNVTPDPVSGAPTIETGFDESGGWQATSRPTAESWYDAGAGIRIGRARASWTRGDNVSSGADTVWLWRLRLSSDDIATITDDSGDLQATGPGTVDLAATGTRRFAQLQLQYPGVGGSDQNNRHYAVYWTNVRVIGDHGLTIHGNTAATEGLLASDLVAHVVQQFAPMLNFTTGSDGTIRPSTFVIPQFAYLDATNAGELVRQATRFGLEDWAVWENKTFHWHPRDQGGRNWRARVGPSRLEESGPQMERLWESVVVQYRDVDGSTRTVGPPGSGAGTESPFLKDADPENPANRLGITRRDMLQAGTLTTAGAIEIGRRFLEAQKHLDHSGRARLVGHVLDDHGILHPYWRVRAGDRIAFVDAADSSYRRIVRAEHDESSLSCSVDLDAPPDALSALLERLGVVLVPLGIG